MIDTKTYDWYLALSGSASEHQQFIIGAFNSQELFAIPILWLRWVVSGFSLGSLWEIPRMGQWYQNHEWDTKFPEISLKRGFYVPAISITWGFPFPVISLPWGFNAPVISLSWGFHVLVISLPWSFHVPVISLPWGFHVPVISLPNHFCFPWNFELVRFYCSV